MAFRWTVASNTMVSLGTLPGGSKSNANAVNADGSVVVGSSTVAGVSRAFRWTQATGMITVDQWLRNNGVQLPNDVTLEARAVSADGNIIVGTLQNNRAFLARSTSNASTPTGTPMPSTATITPSVVYTGGLMDIANFNTSLAGLPRLGPQLAAADLTVNGAHSSPLYTLLSAGQSAVWTTGDAALSKERGFDSSLGLGELGLAHGFANGITLRAAMGGQYSKQNLVFGGESKLSATYVVPEITLALGGNVYASGTGYLSWGELALRRTYSNGFTTDISFGKTQSQSNGFRARLDWKDAANFGPTTISPFASVTRFTGRFSGYTETTGSFPVSINAATETATIARVGGDTLTPISSWTALIGRLEYAHRFETSGSGVAGQIIGLSAFDITGQTLRQNWGRAGVGVRYAIGAGDGIVMINASDQTGRVAGWLSASYRVVF